MIYKFSKKIRTNALQFGKNRSGALAYLTIFAAVPLTVAMFYIANSAKAIQDHTRAQDAADNIAYLHAAEGARSLNTISLNQVTMTQVWATGLVSAKFNNTLWIHRAMLLGAMTEPPSYIATVCVKRYGKIPIVGGILVAACSAPNLLFLAELVALQAETVRVHFQRRPDLAFEISKKGILALNESNSETFNRFPAVVSKLAGEIAESAKVTDIYFDNNCEKGRATSCSNDKRQGMELPVTKNMPHDAYYRFCAALFFGTGGVDLSNSSGQSGIFSKLASFPLINGSYKQRGFKMNEGPMYGGPTSTPYLPDHISKNHEIGNILSDYYKMAKRPKMRDGVINFYNTAAAAADLAYITAQDALGIDISDDISDFKDSADGFVDATVIDGKSIESYKKGLGFNYPLEQTVDSNIFYNQVDVSLVNMCAGDPMGALFDSVPGFNTVLSLVGSVWKTMPTADVYHPKEIGKDPSSLGIIPGIPTIPKILPDVDDFDDDFKPLAFVYRKANPRWSSEIFKDPNDGFVKYSQAITYNPDEIGLYSQNWKARLIPATKMHEPGDVAQRITGNASSNFDDLKDDLNVVSGEPTWESVIVK